MATVGINLSIDVTKIDKSRLHTGKKGTYLDLTAFVDLDHKDQYENNGFITQAQTKEDREAKTQLPILGNSRVFYDNRENKQEDYNGGQQQPESQPQEPGADYLDDDIPF